VDDYSYLAIDLNRSGVAGDDPIEVLIDDNAYTNSLRSVNNGGGGLAEVDINVEAGGEWLAIEFNMGEVGGGDSGIIYWDYDPTAPEGQRLGGQAGFPVFVEDPIDAIDAETMYIPDTHLRSVTRTLQSADRVGVLPNTTTGLAFEIDGDTDRADTLVLNNPDPNVYTTVVDVDGVAFHLKVSGTLQSGDAFEIIRADQIDGTPVIVPADPGQTWTFNPSTGQIIFGAMLPGDYNLNGLLDAEDLDMQAVAIAGGQNPKEYDLNGDDLVNFNDRQMWVDDLKNTWIGDANLNGEFNSSDMVQVFVAGKYEKEETATWGQGDFNGDTFFNSSDMVAAFVGGGYEKGLKDGGPNPAVSAVPEPGAWVLALVGLLGLIGRVWKRS